MAVTIDISDVMARVAFDMHLPDFASGEFISDVQALALAKSSVARLGAMLNRSFGDNYFALTATLATQAEVDLVSLPDRFKDLLSLHWVDGTKSHPLERASITEYNAEPCAWDRGRLPKYRVEGNVLVFTPIPSQVYSLRCAYTTGLSITALTDTIQGQDGWDEWLINDMCILIHKREKTDPSVAMTLKAEAEANIKSQGAARDRHGVVQVRDVRGGCATDEKLFGAPTDWWL